MEVLLIKNLKYTHVIRTTGITELHKKTVLCNTCTLIDLWLGSRPYGLDAPRAYLTGPLCPISIHGSPVTLLKFQMAPRIKLLMSSDSKKAPRYACLSEAKASHSQIMYAEVSSSAPHLIHNGLSDRPIRWRCLCWVLCPIRRPVIALDCVLLKDRNLALAPSQGPEINSRASLWLLPRPRHHTQCWLTNQCLILLLISRLETPKASSGPTNFRIPAHYLTAWLPYVLARVWRISTTSLGVLW
jgi:hypothetical protein